MAFLNQTYTAADLPESTSYEPIPEGWYSATISEAELKDTKAGTGQYLRVRYDVTGPSHQGRVVFGNLNLRNPNSKAEEIGQQQLGELMRAIGLASITDSDELIGGACQIKVVIKDDPTGKYDPSNEIKRWKASTGSPAPAASTQAKPNAAPPTNGARPPWVK